MKIQNFFLTFLLSPIIFCLDSEDDNSYTVDYDDNEIKKDTLDLLVELFNKALIEYQNKNEGNCLGECQNWQQLLEKVADLFDRASYKEDDRNPYDIINNKEKYDNYETNKHHYKSMKLRIKPIYIIHHTNKKNFLLFFYDIL